MGSSSCQNDLETGRVKKSQTAHPAPLFCRSDVAAITDITTAANGGLALIGGWYVYVTVPYVYVAPIVSVGRCTLEFNPLLSYGGPGECKGDNYDNETKSCKSDKTIKDTMGDQGLAGMCDTAGLWPFRHPWPELACPRLRSLGLICTHVRLEWGRLRRPAGGSLVSATHP